MQVSEYDLLDKKLQVCRTALVRYPLRILLSILFTVRPHAAMGVTSVVPIGGKFEFPSRRDRTYI